MYGDLRLPNGACKYYDPLLKLCTVYEQRPLKCRIDDYYEAHLIQTYSRKQYYELNVQACLNFMEQENEGEKHALMLQQMELISRMGED
jgi:Fe-S-cluster containining protein